MARQRLVPLRLSPFSLASEPLSATSENREKGITAATPGDRKILPGRGTLAVGAAGFPLCLPSGERGSGIR